VLEQQRSSTETRLNRLLDRPVATPIAGAAQLPAPSWNLLLDGLQGEAMASSALLRERARQIDERRAALDIARSESKPDWILSGAWMNRGSLPDIWEVNVGITLPIYKDTKQDRAVAEAAAAVRASEHDLQDGSGIVAAAVRDQFLRAERAARLLQLYGEAIIPQATLSLESAAAGYEVGRVDFLTVIDNVVTLLTYQLEYYRQYADYMQALARIEEHVGRSLGATPAAVFGRISVPAGQLESSEVIPGGDR
jgi:outer membrane protein TolC